MTPSLIFEPGDTPMPFIDTIMSLGDLMNVLERLILSAIGLLITGITLFHLFHDDPYVYTLWRIAEAFRHTLHHIKEYVLEDNLPTAVADRSKSKSMPTPPNPTIV